MNRTLKKEYVENLIEILMIEKRDIVFWDKFYKFVIKSYDMKRENRFSLSELSKELKKNDVENPREIIEAYFHLNNIIAILKGEKLYGERTCTNKLDTKMREIL